MQSYFADTLLNVAVTGTLVRLEFGTLGAVPNVAGKQDLRATPTHQVVMPIEGFARAFGMQESVIRKLVADGVLRENKDAGAAAPVVGASAPAT